MKQLTVELPGREYDILIGTGLLEQCGARIRAVTRVNTVWNINCFIQKVIE